MSDDYWWDQAFSQRSMEMEPETEILKGSRVVVLNGQDVGKTGTVERVVVSKRPAFYVRLDSGELFRYPERNLSLFPIPNHKP